jgi:phosphoenolpyruvate-protein phosphotransferase
MLKGRSASGGIAVGRAVVLRSGSGGAARIPVSADRVEDECRRLREAARAASEKLSALARTHAEGIGGEVSAILSAHAMLAVDPNFLKPIERLIRREHVSAAWCLLTVAEELRSRFAESRDPIFSERGNDVLDVARVIAGELSGYGEDLLDSLPPEEGAILVADELTASQAARLHPRRFSGIALEGGGPNSHAAIIARSFGLPAVVGVNGLLKTAARERPIIVDGERGIVEPNPSKPQIRRALERRHAWETARAAQLARRVSAPATADGVRLTFRANVELVEEADSLGMYGAEGIGLFRSEYLFVHDASGTPTAERQESAYRELLRRAKPHPVVIRTYDLGGEKNFESRTRVGNPLGVRGIRYSLSRPDLFREQLRSLLRASPEGDLRILLPMVSSASELKETSRILREIALEEGIEKVPPLGAMIEIPAAAMMSRALASACDFFSIGTNDLAQYTLAADRSDREAASYYQPTSPAVLRMIKWSVEAGVATEHGVSVCGELAGDPVGAILLVGMGVRELSMSPVLIPQVQEACARFTLSKMEDLAERALACSDASEVAEMLNSAKRRIEA